MLVHTLRGGRTAGGRLSFGLDRKARTWTAALNSVVTISFAFHYGSGSARGALKSHSLPFTVLAG